MKTSPELLEEIAKVMRNRPGSGYKGFESCTHGKYEDWETLVKDVLFSPERVQRVPDNIKVYGDIPESALGAAHGICSGSRVDFDERAKHVARTLLDLKNKNGE